MDHEVELDVAAAASAGGFLAWRRRHAMPLGTPCYNCATPLRGPWCYACGQLGEDFHRSAFHLVGELIESLTHADGRLWRTLPDLVTSPATLTHAYLAGKRAPQVPPLRLFLVVLLIVFVAGSFAAGGGLHGKLFQMDTQSQAELQKLQVHLYPPWDAALTEWTRTHLMRAISNPDLFIAAMAAWAHDFAFLTLPISATILSLLFLFRRGFVLFDHLVFSMHSLAFQGLLIVAYMGLKPLIGSGAGWLLVASPVHLFAHMRGVYGLGNFGTIVRMFVLFAGSMIAFTLAMLALVVVGLEALR